MRFNKFVSLFSVFLVTLIFYSFADAAERYDSDVGQGHSLTTDLSGGDYFTFHPVVFAVCDPAPALARHEYISDTYSEPKSSAHASIWNARINYNYQYQLPGKAGPPVSLFPLRE